MRSTDLGTEHGQTPSSPRHAQMFPSISLRVAACHMTWFADALRICSAKAKSKAHRREKFVHSVCRVYTPLISHNMRM